MERTLRKTKRKGCEKRRGMSCSPELQRYFQTLFQWIADHTEITHLTYDGKTFEYHPEDEDLTLHDIKATYFGVIVDLLHHPEKEAKLRYHITHNPSDNPPDATQVDVKLWNLLNQSKSGWNCLPLSFPKPVLLVNVSGVNPDHRGADTEEGASLPFHEKFSMPKHFTLGQLADAFYRIKSHKFDSWYELFTHVNVLCSRDRIQINVSFDHGS
jgi:hypothetical protein